MLSALNCNCSISLRSHLGFSVFSRIFLLLWPCNFDTAVPHNYVLAYYIANIAFMSFWDISIDYFFPLRPLALLPGLQKVVSQIICLNTCLGFPLLDPDLYFSRKCTKQLFQCYDISELIHRITIHMSILIQDPKVVLWAPDWLLLTFYQLNGPCFNHWCHTS